MKNTGLGFHLKPRTLDIFCIILIIGLDPIAHFFFFSPGIFSQDAFAYATMARDLFGNGLLYIPSWGHVDQGMILPPFYPFLIACGRFFSCETLNVAEYVSSICMLAFTVPIYLIIKRMTNRIGALISTCIIEINYYYFYIGMSPLAESVFLLTLGLTLWLVSLIFSNPLKNQKVLHFVMGISCSLVFLSRQIGVLIYAFIGILFLLQYLNNSGNDRKTLINNYLYAFCGVLILLIPYSVALYLQTGQHPLTQGFKKYEYAIKVSDPKILNEITQEKNIPAEVLDSIGIQTDNAYGITYAERRRMRKLLPDASEMYSYVSVVGNKTKTDKRLKTAISNFKDPGAYFRRVYNNILNLKSALGGFNIILFFVLCFLPLILKTDNIKNFRIFLLPSFIIFYLLVISLLTAKIPRYVYILFPFCIAHISIVLLKYLNRIKDISKIKLSQPLIYIILFLLILITTPRFFTDLNLARKFTSIENDYGSDLKKIINGEPVFSLTAYEAYMVGSPYRILPNDSLDKIATYAKKTGVHWLLVTQMRSTVSELKLYNNVYWYSIPLLEGSYSDLVEFRACTSDGAIALYEFL